MNTRVSLLALGVGAYLAFAVVSFPASIAHRWFAPDELALASVKGTIWRGSADYGGFNGIGFSGLNWDLHPVALLTGGLSVSVRSDFAGGLLRAELTSRGNRVVLNDLRASASLGLLPLQQVEGSVSVAIERLELVDGWPVAATGTVRVTNLSAPPLFSIPGVTTIPLGDFLARFNATSEPDLIAEVIDEGGPLELIGQLNLRPDRSYRLEARIKPRPEALDVLIQGLDLMYPANAAGQHEIEHEDRL